MRTRAAIVRRAADLFADQGFHNTSIDAIAKAAGASRATVYQYFRSKDDILAELADQCRPALIAHAERFGALAPDERGLQSLRTWLSDLADLYDLYTVVFVVFPGVGMHQEVPAASPDGGVGDAYLNAITAEVCRAGVTGLDAADMAAAVLRVAHMVNLYRSRRMFGLGSSTATTESLAIALLRLLFPAWQPAATAASTRPRATASTIAAPPARPVIAPASSTTTVRLDVLAAASALFAEHGYHAVSMEDIALAAQVGRTTLYRHFSTKVAVLAELTDWAVLEGGELWTELHQLAVTGATPTGLRGWLSRYVHYHRSYGAVIRAWYDGTVAEQLPEDIVSQGLGGFHAAVHSLLATAELPPGIDEDVAAAFFLAVLGRLSEMTVSRHPDFSDYDAAGLMYTVVQRALLSADPAFAEPPVKS
nr:TetR family transcriptional regulator [Mycobacterium eburneum]